MNRNYACAVARFLGFVLALSGIASSAFAEVTISQPITELRYWGDADYAFFIGPARWGSSSCPNAYYAQIPAGAANAKQLLAIALAAKLAGSNVSFQGSCSSDPSYFNINYIIVD